MTTIYKWRVYCTTDSKYETGWAEAEPTVCFANTAHSIDSQKTVILETREANLVSIREENTPTGGHFCTTTMTVDCSRNMTQSKTQFWDIPISALAMNFVTSSVHTGDTVDILVGENTIIGVLTANASSALAWVSQNYTAGDVVTYTDPDFGARVYTCTTNTVSNEVPSDETYWQHGFELSVSQTVIDNTSKGYHINLFDGVNSDTLDMVLHVDSVNNKIYVKNNLSYGFLASSPTYVRQTVYTVKDYKLDVPWEHEIGQSKIGASYVPKDTRITLRYTNNSTDTDKSLTGRVEFLY